MWNIGNGKYRGIYWKSIKVLLEDFNQPFDDFRSYADIYILCSEPFACNPRDVSEDMQL